MNMTCSQRAQPPALLDALHGQPPLQGKPRLVASAKDMYFTTAEGKQVLDGLATLWCVNAGHGRPRIVEAIRKPGGRARLRLFVLARPSARPSASPSASPASRRRACSRFSYQLGLRGGRHRAQDRGRLPPAARPGHAHALRRPRALVPRRQHRRHFGRRRAVQPQGLQRHADAGRGLPAAYPRSFQESLLPRDNPNTARSSPTSSRSASSRCTTRRTSPR